jgi:hypothetical protein
VTFEPNVDERLYRLSWTDRIGRWTRQKNVMALLPLVVFTATSITAFVLGNVPVGLGFALTGLLYLMFANTN